MGEEYRSIILYETEEERKIAEKMIQEIEDSLKTMSARGKDMPIVTQVVPLEEFYPAEGNHQNFYKKNQGSMYCNLVIEPKIEKVRKRFSELVTQDNH